MLAVRHCQHPWQSGAKGEHCHHLVHISSWAHAKPWAHQDWRPWMEVGTWRYYVALSTRRLFGYYEQLAALRGGSLASHNSCDDVGQPGSEFRAAWRVV